MQAVSHFGFVSMMLSSTKQSKSSEGEWTYMGDLMQLDTGTLMVLTSLPIFQNSDAHWLLLKIWKLELSKREPKLISESYWLTLINLETS